MYHDEPRSVVSARAAYSQYDPCLVVHGVTKDDLEERIATRMKSMLIWITALGLIAPWVALTAPAARLITCFRWHLLERPHTEQQPTRGPARGIREMSTQTLPRMMSHYVLSTGLYLGRTAGGDRSLRRWGARQSAADEAVTISRSNTLSVTISRSKTLSVTISRSNTLSVTISSSNTLSVTISPPTACLSAPPPLPPLPYSSL